MANAGHTAVWDDGQKFIAKALPSAAILSKWTNHEYNPLIFVGASSAFHLDQMLKEINETKACVFIHPRAGVITNEHRIVEESATTGTKHVASTMQGCGTFLADKIMRRQGLKLAGDYHELANHIATPESIVYALADHFEATVDILLKECAKTGSIQQLMACLVNNANIFQATILHEGSQGFSLDINHGSHYPYCTSRGTTATQNLADMGLPAKAMGDIYLVIRPYPIRVGNVIEDGDMKGFSGGHYDDHVETDWETVMKQSGAPESECTAILEKELTTVTKRLRRVFTFSKKQLKDAVAVNGATRIALNFANYIDWSCTGCNDPNNLPVKVTDFIKMIEDTTDIPVTIVGTGPKNTDVCFI